MAHNSLGNILASRGKFDEALMHYQTALQVRPDFATAYTSIGNVLAARGQFREALDHYQKALKVQPQDPSAPYSLAWLRATCPDASIRNSEEAIELAQRASRLSGGQQPQTFDALAAAYAEAGWFPEALATAQSPGTCPTTEQPPPGRRLRAPDRPVRSRKTVSSDAAGSREPIVCSANNSSKAKMVVSGGSAAEP